MKLKIKELDVEIEGYAEVTIDGNKLIIRNPATNYYPFVPYIQPNTGTGGAPSPYPGTTWISSTVHGNGNNIPDNQKPISLPTIFLTEKDNNLFDTKGPININALLSVMSNDEAVPVQ